MTNAEKYLKDGVDVEELSNGIVMFEVKEIGWQIAENEKDRIKRFFEQSLKPTLTEDEKVILRNIKPYTHIRRTDNGELRIYYYTTETLTSGHSMSEYNHLFQFIKPRRRI